MAFSMRRALACRSLVSTSVTAPSLGAGGPPGRSRVPHAETCDRPGRESPSFFRTDTAACPAPLRARPGDTARPRGGEIRARSEARPRYRPAMNDAGGYFGERVAATYDDPSSEEFDPAVIERTADVLAGLAGPRPGNVLTWPPTGRNVPAGASRSHVSFWRAV